jgi:hypothetical protein
MDYEERGVWHEVLLMMHDSEDRGRLVLDGRPIPILRLAKLLGISAKKTEKFFKIFTELRVCSVDENGAFFNRRMVRDEAKRQAKSRAGKAGMESRWGDDEDNSTDNKDVTDSITEDITNGGSSVSSSSSKPSPLPPQVGEPDGKKKNPRADKTNPRAVAAREAEEKRERERQAEDARLEAERLAEAETERRDRLDTWPPLIPDLDDLDFDRTHTDPDGNRCAGDFEVHDMTPPLMKQAVLRCETCGHEVHAANPRAPAVEFSEVLADKSWSAKDYLQERVRELEEVVL